VHQMRALLHESEVRMTKESDQLDQTEASSSVNGPRAKQSSAADLMSPVLYDLVMWGFAEINACGQRVLRRDIQARLDGHELTEQELDDFEGSPLYVGFRCQSCWEAAVTLLAYGHHLCAWHRRPVDLPRY
jgi:hypothetical protein